MINNKMVNQKTELRVRQYFFYGTITVTSHIKHLKQTLDIQTIQPQMQSVYSDTM